MAARTRGPCVMPCPLIGLCKGGGRGGRSRRRSCAAGQTSGPHRRRGHTPSSPAPPGTRDCDRRPWARRRGGSGAESGPARVPPFRGNRKPSRPVRPHLPPATTVQRKSAAMAAAMRSFRAGSLAQRAAKPAAARRAVVMVSAMREWRGPLVRRCRPRGRHPAHAVLLLGAAPAARAIGPAACAWRSFWWSAIGGPVGAPACDGEAGARARSGAAGAQAAPPTGPRPPRGRRDVAEHDARRRAARRSAARPLRRRVRAPARRTLRSAAPRPRLHRSTRRPRQQLEAAGARRQPAAARRPRAPRRRRPPAPPATLVPQSAKCDDVWNPLSAPPPLPPPPAPSRPSATTCPTPTPRPSSSSPRRRARSRRCTLTSTLSAPWSRTTPSCGSCCTTPWSRATRRRRC
jgi:hypothetical protein